MSPGLRRRHAFEYAVVHANGEVVCSIIDGRGDFVIGNIHEQSLSDILSDDQFTRAITLAERHGIQIHFDFAHTWGRSRRRPGELRYLTPYLKPFTALPGEPRQDGW